MAGFTIQGGARIETATPDEVRQIVQEQSASERAWLRGIKDLRRSTLLSTPAGTRVTILDGITPESGYKWVIRFISVYLASAGTGQAFITTDTTSTLGALTQSKPVAVFTTSAQYATQNLPEGACILGANEGLYLNFTQNINGYMIAGWEVPAEMIGKLV